MRMEISQLILPGDILVVSAVGFTTQRNQSRKFFNYFNYASRGRKENCRKWLLRLWVLKRNERSLGYSVTDLNAKELMKNKNTNVINSLAGKVPGVNITQFSGSAGAGASITIRGGNFYIGGKTKSAVICC